MKALTESEWKAVAAIVVQPHIRDMLIARAMETPYFHLKNKDGSPYMDRFHLFNPTPELNDGKGKQYPDLPSVRIHHIRSADDGRDPHNHPWSARSIILKGWYLERRDDGCWCRSQGDTFEISADTFHHIETISEGGVWTLFISGDWVQTWGFRTAEGFVPWRQYLGIPEGQEG